jgi:hypothetical protein
MDHTYIKEHNVVERYEMDKLTPAESACFEEHFVDCPECQSQLTTARDLRQALRAAATENGNLPGLKATSPRIGVPVSRLAAASSAACLVLLMVTVVFLVRETLHLQRQLSQANDASRALRQRYEAERQSNTERQQQPTQPGDQNDSASGLPVIASVFALDITRGDESGGSGPADRVVLSKSPQWVVLSLDLNGNHFQSYRATLAHSGGEALWKAGGLTPARTNTLGLTFPSGFFRQGDYFLTLEGQSRQGSYAVAGHYSFRVTIKP